ncbi:MAG: outer membrane protein assembly factor BamE [Rhodospirillaceae bacterium]|jgi:outer membrane protein assembly factor BamE (lipoprotein component of BamABCDE complex)|nr:outer membrane protein assembly factor BamE [Rhodospirillaceae bacterium]MBT4588169.1 outer membrane protein assembly factor BamE [Rhodospirillaceae bacterium]MBT4940965.1 outer membrane protein assembly factor BamE [Rhodospirillaceae bacterium]MBT5940485.1 outer membrane protein assembly factor BamE [Rhodospirillaceae bacterium]MBT7266992.1 outer membrane protein assembly factor BamE [Rhodospirillaceae bacterium]
MQTKFFSSPKIGKIVLAGVVALSVTACAPRVASRGNLPDPDLLANIEVGQVNKRDVIELIGSPSSTELFKGESWYYISERTETKAFFEPKVVERKVIIIRFNEKGIVKELKAIGLKEARDIEMVDRVTPTAGQEMTILKQLFGNVGRFEGGGGGAGTIIDN